MHTKWKFEEFEAGPVIRNAHRIHVTINPKGYFYLNGNAVKALDEPDAVVLFYDRRLQTIAMKRALMTKQNAYRLKPKDGHSFRGRILYAANFCKHYHIKPKRTLAFINPSIHDGHLILSMHDTAPAAKKK